MVDEQEWLERYRADGDGEAFARIVGRYVGLVYGCARRQVHGADAHLAEDVTQAVFLVLARQAGRVKGAGMLGGWLVNTTRNVARNAVRTEGRRRKYERMAGVMKHEMAEAARGDEAELEGMGEVLDDALGRLRPAERAAVVLRYLQGRSVEEVAAMLGVSRAAAAKRVERALDRLRDILARRGVVAPTVAAVAAGLVAEGAKAAAVPAGMAASVAAGATGGGAASAAAVGLAQTVAAGGTKVAAWATAAMLVVTTGVVMLVAAGAEPQSTAPVGGQVAQAPATAATTQSGATTRAADRALPGGGYWRLFVERVTDYRMREVPEVVRGGEPVGVLEAVVPRPTGMAARHRILWAGGLVGPVTEGSRRVELSMDLKLEGVDQYAGPSVTATGDGGRILVLDDGARHRLSGSRDWRRYTTVFDLPSSATMATVGVALRGRGAVWMGDMRVREVGKDVPVTDDSAFQMYSFHPALYEGVVDEKVKREGRATMRLSSDAATMAQWAYYVRHDRFPEKWRGKQVKYSVWVKAEGVTAPSGPSVRVLGRNFVKLVEDPDKKDRGRRPITGNIGWTKFEYLVDVPEAAEDLCYGIVMNGKGKLWMDEPTVELATGAGEGL